MYFRYTPSIFMYICLCPQNLHMYLIQKVSKANKNTIKCLLGRSLVLCLTRFLQLIIFLTVSFDNI